MEKSKTKKTNKTLKDKNILLENIKKYYLLVIPVLFLVILIIIFFINGKSTVITFDTDGGSTIKNIIVKSGKYEMPSDPVKEGFIFNGC